MFRQVDTRIWTDPKVRSLSCPSARLVWVYLLTNDHTHMSGLYYLPDTLAAHELRMDQGKYRSCREELEACDLCRYDPIHELIWVIRMGRYQIRSRKGIGGVSKHLEKYHESCLIPEYLRTYDTLSIPYSYPIDTQAVQAVSSKQQAVSRSSKQCPDPSRSDPATNEPTQWTTSPPPPPPSAPDQFLVTDDHEQIAHRLREHHAQMWGLQPRGQVRIDVHLERIARVIDRYGEAGCEQIQRGHRVKAKADKKIKTGWRFAYPHPAGCPGEPDLDWIAEYYQAGSKKGSGTMLGSQPAEPDETPEQRRERIERLAQESIAREAREDDD